LSKVQYTKYEYKNSIYLDARSMNWWNEWADENGKKYTEQEFEI
jgi:hypothetical protein